MDVQVRMRINKETGEVEVFEVVDVGSTRLPEAEHNRTHDRIATSIGSVLERNPLVDEVIHSDPSMVLRLPNGVQEQAQEQAPEQGQDSDIGRVTEDAKERRG